MTNAFSTKPTLRLASRLPALTRETGVSAVEIALLLGCGALATAMVGFVHLRMGVPGHAILRAAIPMAMGFAFVPRRAAGMIMTVGAGLTCVAMSAVRVGMFQPAAMLSLLLLGPVLDFALLGDPKGWRLYARFITGGAAANLLAYLVKLATVSLGWSAGGGRNFTAFGPTALLSVLLCGALAGLISAALWFRLGATDDLRRN